tara:strand:+ start:392 stop:1039 length:648 start_codon:yes stop_codon:yes gene_type:complete
MTPQQVYNLLDTNNITSKVGTLTFDLADISFTVQTKDVVGGILQEWFENFLSTNNVQFEKPHNSQEWPDLILLPQNEDLEVKAFNHAKSPGFDIANFDAYTRSLLEHPERLDTEHIIFAYESDGKNIQIKDFWLKKAWQMTGPSDTNYLNLQVKQNQPTNIRPKNWRSKRSVTFNSRREFVVQLNNALVRFYPDRHPNWFQQVESKYQQKVRQSL